MTHHIELLQKLFSSLTKAVSIILLIVTFFVLQYLLDMDYVCSCDPHSHITGAVFMALPPLILSCLVTLIESFYKKTICYQRACCCGNCMQLFGFFFAKYLFLTGIWAGAVLLQGDWYICLITNTGGNHRGIACKENLTDEEKHTKATYKNESVDIGFGVLSALFIIWNIYEFCKPVCIMRRFNENIKSSVCPSYYRWVYEELLSEEVSNHLKEELKNIAEEKAKKLCEGHLSRIRNAELQTENHHSNNPVQSNSDEPNPSNSESDAGSGDALFPRSDDPHSNADSETDTLAAWCVISEPYFYLSDYTQVGRS